MGTQYTDANVLIFEFIAYNRKLNSTEYANVVNYLKTKYTL